MRKIGIFGGTFNPVHNGHINIAKTANWTLSNLRFGITMANSYLAVDTMLQMPNVETKIWYEANSSGKYTRVNTIIDSIHKICDSTLPDKSFNTFSLKLSFTTYQIQSSAFTFYNRKNIFIIFSIEEFI